jgi:hypothetical protein
MVAILSFGLIVGCMAARRFGPKCFSVYTFETKEKENGERGTARSDLGF